jgi:hypothetical protein
MLLPFLACGLGQAQLEALMSGYLEEGNLVLQRGPTRSPAHLVFGGCYVARVMAMTRKKKWRRLYGRVCVY